MGVVWSFLRRFIPLMNNRGGGRDKTWTHATLTLYSGADCGTYASHQTVELGGCIPYSDGSPDYVMWKMADMVLTRYDYGTDATCADENLNEGNEDTWTMADKEAETKCMASDSDSYMITKPWGKVTIKEFAADDACTEANESVVGEDVPIDECHNPEGTSTYQIFEWRGDGINVIDFLLQHDMAEVTKNIEKRVVFLRFFIFYLLGCWKDFMIDFWLILGRSWDRKSTKNQSKINHKSDQN